MGLLSTIIPPVALREQTLVLFYAAGEKKSPRGLYPAATQDGSLLTDHFRKFFLADDRNAQFLRFCQLAAGVLPRKNIARLF